MSKRGHRGRLQGAWVWPRGPCPVCPRGPYVHDEGRSVVLTFVPLSGGAWSRTYHRPGLPWRPCFLGPGAAEVKALPRDGPWQSGTGVSPPLVWVGKSSARAWWPGGGLRVRGQVHGGSPTGLFVRGRPRLVNEAGSPISVPPSGGLQPLCCRGGPSRCSGAVGNGHVECHGLDPCGGRSVGGCPSWSVLPPFCGGCWREFP